MSKIQELSRKITDGQSKLSAHQKEVTYWLEELRRLNVELKRETVWENEEAKRASMKKAA